MVKFFLCVIFVFLNSFFFFFFFFFAFVFVFFFFFSSRRRHTRLQGDWSSDVCSSDLVLASIEPPSPVWQINGSGFDELNGPEGSSPVAIPIHCTPSKPMAKRAVKYRTDRKSVV